MKIPSTKILRLRAENDKAFYRAGILSKKYLKTKVGEYLKAKGQDFDTFITL